MHELHDSTSLSHLRWIAAGNSCHAPGSRRAQGLMFALLIALSTLTGPALANSVAHDAAAQDSFDRLVSGHAAAPNIPAGDDPAEAARGGAAGAAATPPVATRVPPAAASVVPEPGTWTLVFAGLLAIGLSVRSRRST